MGGKSPLGISMGPNHILVYQWVVNTSLLRIVNVSVIVLYNVVYDFRVLEMHVDACVSIHSRFHAGLHVCVFYACHAYSVCACVRG